MKNLKAKLESFAIWLASDRDIVFSAKPANIFATAMLFAILVHVGLRFPIVDFILFGLTMVNLGFAVWGSLIKHRPSP